MAATGPKKQVRWLRYAILALALLAAQHILSGPSGVLNLIRLRRQGEAQARAIDSLAARKRDMERERARLASDTAYLELVARKELGMARPDEKVFQFVAGSRPPAAAHP